MPVTRHGFVLDWSLPRTPALVPLFSTWNPLAANPSTTSTPVTTDPTGRPSHFSVGQRVRMVATPEEPALVCDLPSAPDGYSGEIQRVIYITPARVDLTGTSPYTDAGFWYEIDIDLGEGARTQVAIQGWQLSEVR